MKRNEMYDERRRCNRFLNSEKFKNILWVDIKIVYRTKVGKKNYFDIEFALDDVRKVEKYSLYYLPEKFFERFIPEYNCNENREYKLKDTFNQELPKFEFPDIWVLDI